MEPKFDYYKNMNIHISVLYEISVLLQEAFNRGGEGGLSIFCPFVEKGLIDSVDFCSDTL